MTVTARAPAGRVTVSVPDRPAAVHETFQVRVAVTVYSPVCSQACPQYGDGALTPSGLRYGTVRRQVCRRPSPVSTVRMPGVAVMSMVRPSAVALVRRTPGSGAWNQVWNPTAVAPHSLAAGSGSRRRPGSVRVSVAIARRAASAGSTAGPAAGALPAGASGPVVRKTG